MGRQNLRQPEFSEDSPWLPTWLQPEWSAFAEKTMSSHPICETECKGLEGFPKSIEYLEEAINGTTTEVVTRQICPLFLSGDDCTATEKSQSPEIALALCLSFSSEDNSECCAAKFIEGSPQEAYQSHVVLENHISVPNTQLEFAGKTNQNMHPIPSATHFIGMEEDPMCGKVLSECKILSQSYTQQTPCTELYVPGIIQQENNLNDTICGAGYDLAYVSRSSELLTIRTSPSSLDGTLGSESCVPGRTVMENAQNSLKRQSRKRKSIDRSEGQLSDKITDSKLTTVDIDVAIGLTVAAAEALVISNLMDACMLSESIGCSEILEAALKLKQARQICGLDSFLGVSTEPVNVEDSSLDDLDDSIMEEAFADVGLFELENIVSPVGACCADALKSDDTEEHSHGNMPSFLSKKEELINDFDEREFNPSKQELETNGSDRREDNGVIFSGTTVSFPDTSISKCLTSVEGAEDQQRYSMERLHASLEHAGGELFIHSMDAKPSGIGICVANVTGKSENSLSRNMGTIGSQEKPSSPVCRKCNEGDSFQSEFLSMDKLVHDLNKRQNAAVETAVGITHFNKQFDTNGNAAVETAAGNTHSNKQIDTIDKETNCACPTEDAVLIQSSVTCSPSWLSLTGDKVKEIVSFDVSESSDSLEWQSQIQAEISCKKESEKSHDTTVTRILSVEPPRPFNSRWFGGWAGLEKETEKNKTFEATMCVQKPFVEETSYLTESLDMDIGHPTSVKYHSGEALKQPSNVDCDFLDMDIQDLSSSNKVRTTKFLYGCAVGSLLLQPGWIIDSIAAKCCLPYDKYLLKSKVSNVCQWLKQKNYDTTDNGIPLFRGIRIMLYGKPAFYSKLMILIKHAGGQVFRTIKSLVQGCEYTQSASAMIVVEDERAAPRNLRQCASEYRIPLMSGNWIIESLLLGRLLPFRTNTSSGSQSSGKRGHLRNSLIKKSPDCWNRSEPNAARLLGSNNTGADHLISSKDVKGPSCKEDTLYKASTIICGLEVSVTPPSVPKLGIMLPRKYAEHSAKQQQGSNCLYYKKVAFNDVLYSIGDVVELVPISEAEETHLARIECLWSVKAAKVKSRLKKRNEVANSCERLFLQCRWFYRPSDTGFPCTGSGNEIYVSNCFKDISVQKIIKKVSVVFMVDGKIFPMNATNEKGDPSSCISEDEQTTDFICKFFYDYENESLHQLKI